MTVKGSCHCGAVTWEFDGTPDSVTACNCTVCHRYGALWAYDWLDEGIRISGETTPYIRGHRMLSFNFCNTCGNVAYWKGLLEEEGRIRIAVNMRLTDPGPIADVPVRHFEGLETFQDQPVDGRCVSDYWY